MLNATLRYSSRRFCRTSVHPFRSSFRLCHQPLPTVKQQTSPTVWEGVLDKTEYIITSTRILQRRDVHQISAQQNAAILLNLVLELLRSDTTSTTILKTPPPPLLKKENIPLESGKLANVLAKA